MSQEEVKKPMIEAAKGNKPARYPVWFMRQAGRYLPEYREIRQDMDFVTLCKTPKKAAEVTIQPLKRYDLDAAIIFSDILIAPMVMGQDLTFGKGHGPRLAPPVRSMSDVQSLKIPDAQKEMGFVGDAIVETRKQLRPDQTMIGFAGAPFTVATYMIEGQTTRTFTEIKGMVFQQPETLKALMSKLVEVSVDYLEMQVKAGADIVMLFDTWAGELTPMEYELHIQPHMKSLFSELSMRNIPRIYFPGQGSDRLHLLKDYDVDVVSIDWRTDMRRAVDILKAEGINVTVQGNLDPQTLTGPESLVRERTRQIVEAAGGARSHIFNVGHGLMPHIPPESLNWVIDELRKIN